jgi:hypothetical protein
MRGNGREASPLTGEQPARAAFAAWSAGCLNCVVRAFYGAQLEANLRRLTAEVGSSFIATMRDASA